MNPSDTSKEYNDEYHSSGINPHEFVFLRLNEIRNKVKRNAVRKDYSESMASSEKIVTIRGQNNITYYVLISPNKDLLASNFSIEADHREVHHDEHDIITDCFYHGIILSPIKGWAAISSCGNDKMVRKDVHLSAI